MTNPLSEVRELSSNLLWRMLATLGAPAAAEPMVETAVDPECALVLGSIHAERDARAAELTLWLGAAARRSLSVTRAKRIVQDIGSSAQVALSAFAATARATDVGDLKTWARRFGSDGAKPWPIEYSRERLRDRIGATESLGAALTQPGAFRLRMRMAIGAGARAEALAMLLVEARFWDGRGAGWLTLPELEWGTGFGKRFLLDCLLDMATSGLILHKRDGRSHAFAANRLLVEGASYIPTIWGAWPQRIAQLTSIETALAELERDPTITTALEQARQLGSTSRLFEQFVAPPDPDQVVPMFESWCLNATGWIVDIA